MFCLGSTVGTVATGLPAVDDMSTSGGERWSGGDTGRSRDVKQAWGGGGGGIRAWGSPVNLEEHVTDTA